MENTGAGACSLEPENLFIIGVCILFKLEMSNKQWLMDVWGSAGEKSGLFISIRESEHVRLTQDPLRRGEEKGPYAGSSRNPYWFWMCIQPEMITNDWRLLEAILDFPDFEDSLAKPQLQNIVLIIGMVVSLKLIAVDSQRE